MPAWDDIAAEPAGAVEASPAPPKASSLGRLSADLIAVAGAPVVVAAELGPGRVVTLAVPLPLAGLLFVPLHVHSDYKTSNHISSAQMIL